MGKYTEYLNITRERLERIHAEPHDLDKCAICLKAFLPQAYERKASERNRQIFASKQSTQNPDGRLKNEGSLVTQFKKSQTSKTVSVDSA